MRIWLTKNDDNEKGWDVLIRTNFVKTERESSLPGYMTLT